MDMRSPIKSPDSVVEGMKQAKLENGDAEDGSMTDAMVVDTNIKSETRDEQDDYLSGPQLKHEDGSHESKPGHMTPQNVKNNEEEEEEIIGAEITLKMEPGQPPKLARSSTQKVPARSPKLFDHLADATMEATRTFQVIEHCTYTPKHLGDTEHAMECDCAEEWDSTTKANYACGEDSDCINRATKMECIGDCGCGADCLNQRFQRREYADVSVIKTEKKGHGLRANADLLPGQFIYEYIGEVINETQFRKRMLQYDEEGIKHFYFMSLTRGEFVDATKRGNLGRFCNHSCNPNCYVDKWVVGNKLRMGIFAERGIKAGEELVFNYNVDRYGADPQPCYCGEPNCTGYIGGKTQTERATKLSIVIIEALGIDDGDGWDTAVAKRPRKKKANEDDEEYVNNVQPKPLDEESVTKVMASLLQNKEKWITVKLLNRIEQSDDERIINRVVRMHGYQILKSVLTAWKVDVNIVLQVFNILESFPRLTKNKITDSKIESTVEELLDYQDEAVCTRASNLLQEWSQLETAYRIPRKKRDPNAPAEPQTRSDWREDRNGKTRRSRSRSKSRSNSPPRGPAIPSGPRGTHSQRQFFPNSRPPFRPPRPFGALPEGWFAASSNGRTYYYTSSGETQWKRPTAPTGNPAPPPPPKAVNATKKLDDLINEITSAKSHTPEKASASGTPKAVPEEPKPEKKQGTEKWKSYSEDKQKKLYENTLFPHVKAIVDKYRKLLPKEDCKRFFKEVSKKLVNSDFKNGRVEDPNKISEKQLKNLRKYVKEFFDKAVAKNKERELGREKRKADRSDLATSSKDGPEQVEPADGIRKEDSDVDAVDATDDEREKADKNHSDTPATPFDQGANGESHKRKRDEQEGFEGADLSAVPDTPSKRIKSESPSKTPPPPPPPPEGGDHDDFVEDSENSLTYKFETGPVDNLVKAMESEDIREETEAKSILTADGESASVAPPSR